MSTINRALEIANDVDRCWYRPINGDIIVSPRNEPTEVISIYYANWSEQDVKDFYLNHSSHFADGCWMGVSMEDGLTLSVCVNDNQDEYDKEIQKGEELFKSIKRLLEL